MFLPIRIGNIPFMQNLNQQKTIQYRMWFRFADLRQMQPQNWEAGSGSFLEFQIHLLPLLGHTGERMNKCSCSSVPFGLILVCYKCGREDGQNN